VLSLAPHIEDRLLPRLSEADVVVAARPAGTAEAAEALRRLKPDLLVASAGSRHLDAALLAAAGALGIAVVVLADGRADVERAATLGVPDPLPADAEPAELLARLRAAPQPAVPAAEPAAPAAGPGRGRVTAVWGPAGAPGRTTTAITLAAELAATGARVALVDADTYGAAIAPSLGLFDEAPGLAAACRLAAAGALDAAELDRIAQHHRGARGSIAVLTGIGRPARWPELSTDRVTRVLEQCRAWADHTVVDTGFSLEADEEIVSDLFAPRRNAATLAAVRAADTVVAVGAGDPVGLARFVRAYGDLLETVETPRIHVLVSKVRASAIGLGPGGQIRAGLQRFGGIEEATLVPNDPAAYDAALLTARSLPDAAPRSAAVQVLRRFTADHLTEARFAEVRRRPFRLRRPLAV
jgi:Mrp family chromosome partitioning ATPase